MKLYLKLIFLILFLLTSFWSFKNPELVGAQTQCTGTTTFATACAPSVTGDCVSTSTTSVPCYFNTQRNACSADIQNSICAWVTTSEGLKCQLSGGGGGPSVVTIDCGASIGNCKCGTNSQTTCIDTRTTSCGGIVGVGCSATNAYAYNCTTLSCKTCPSGPTSTPTMTPTLTPTSTPTPVPAMCKSISVFNSQWIPMVIADLVNTKAGDVLHYCVSGSSTVGTFDMARFTINGVLNPNTTLVRPGYTEFCQRYTVPANVYSFNVVGEIHNTVSGWVQ